MTGELCLICAGEWTGRHHRHAVGWIRLGGERLWVRIHDGFIVSADTNLWRSDDHTLWEAAK